MKNDILKLTVHFGNMRECAHTYDDYVLFIYKNTMGLSLFWMTSACFVLNFLFSYPIPVFNTTVFNDFS